VLQGWCGRPYPGVVGHDAIRQRNVEIFADEDPFARDVDGGDRSLQSLFAM
jgi:hypothetical protein